MPELQIGSVIQNNESRLQFTITSLNGNYVYYHTGRRTQRLRRDRIHLDATRRHRDYSLITSPPAEVDDGA